MKYRSLIVLLGCFYSALNAQNVKPENNETLLLAIDTVKVNLYETNKINYNVLLNKANTFYLKGQYTEAISDYSKAIEIDPTNYLAYMNRSLAYSKIQEYEKSLSDINNAIKIEPANYQCFYNRGMLYHDTKQFNLGIIDFEKAVELKKDFSYSYLYLGECYFSVGDANNSIRNFNLAIQLDSSNYEAYYSRSVYYSNLNMMDQQFKDLKKCIFLNPENSSALNNLGYYFKDSDLDSALYYYSIAVKLEETNLRYRANRARAYQNKKDYQKAIDDLTFAINIAPEESFFYKRRSEVYTLMGQKIKAQQDLDMYNKLKTTE